MSVRGDNTTPISNDGTSMYSLTRARANGVVVDADSMRTDNAQWGKA